MLLALFQSNRSSNVWRHYFIDSVKWKMLTPSDICILKLLCFLLWLKRNKLISKNNKRWKPIMRFKIKLYFSQYFQTVFRFCVNVNRLWVKSLKMSSFLNNIWPINKLTLLRNNSLTSFSKYFFGRIVPNFSIHLSLSTFSHFF